MGKQPGKGTEFICLSQQVRISIVNEGQTSSYDATSIHARHSDRKSKVPSHESIIWYIVYFFVLFGALTVVGNEQGGTFAKGA